jgi:hypothetical protein
MRTLVALAWVAMIFAMAWFPLAAAAALNNP